MVVACLEEPLRHCPRGTEENHENTRESCHLPGTELGRSQVQIRRITTVLTRPIVFC